MRILPKMAATGGSTLEAGFGMLELLVSITIGTFVVAGLFSLLYNLTLASTSHTSLASLEDNERVAMMAIQNVVQNAGYVPQNYYFTTAATQPLVASGLPISTAPSDAPAPGFNSAGQFMYGVSGSSASDSIYIRYIAGSAANGSDGVTDCVGRSFSTGSVYGYPFSAKFSVDGSGNLICTAYDNTNAATNYYIASGLSTSASAPGLQISYGVDYTSTSGMTGSVTEYIPASAMTNYWYVSSTSIYKSYIRSVKFTLNFVNPLYNNVHSTYNSGQPATVQFSFVVFLINNPTGAT